MAYSDYRLLDRLYGSNHRLLFLLVSSRWFRWCFFVFLLLIVGVPLACLKLFDSTPPDVNPEFKMSVVDFIQARSLAAAARKLSEDIEAEKRFEHWRLAIGNNPGSLSNNRAYLHSLLRFDRMRRHWQDGVRTCLWVQKLSRTNQVDLELSCRVFDHYGFDEMVLHSIDQLEVPRSEGVEVCYLRALFHRGRLAEFSTAWDKSPEWIRQGRVLSLYGDAYKAMSSDPVIRSKGQACLDEAKGQAATEVSAHRLQLRVSFENNDLDQFQAALAYLEERYLVRINDHRLWWELLDRLGQTEVAKEAALRSVIRPRCSSEVIEIADALVRLDLRGLAMRYLKNYATEFGFNEAAWCAQAAGFVYDEHWDGLVRVAVGIRLSKDVTAAMMAYSYYLEGKGEYERGRRLAASEAFRQIDGEDLLGGELAPYVGSNLWALGYAEKAFEVLWPARVRYRGRTAFWELLWQVGAALSRQPPMILAMENLCRLNPDNLLYQVNHASLLISQRVQMERALAITFDAFVQYPDNRRIRINYGQALLLSGRVADAAEILKLIDPATLTVTEQQGYFMAWTELYYLRGHVEKAWEVAQKVIPELLLPSDRAHFESMTNDLGARREGDSTELIAKPLAKDA